MMTRTSLFVLVAVGAAADVPHWMQHKAMHPVASVNSIMAPILSFENRLKQQTGNSRRLQKIMSDECAAACPGVPDMIKSMMEAAMAETTPAPEGTDPAVAAMMAMCPYAETLVCAGMEEACQDEEPEDDPRALACICECPDLMAAFTDPSKACVPSTKSCFTGTESCKPLIAEMGGKEVLTIQCDQGAAGCEEKLMAMATSPDFAAWMGEGCEDAAGKGTLASMKDTCCPSGEKLTETATKECLGYTMALQKIQADAGDDTAKADMDRMLQIGEVCKGTGLPASEADVAAIISPPPPAPPATEAPATTDAAPSQAAPILAIMTAMVALRA